MVDILLPLINFYSKTLLMFMNDILEYILSMSKKFGKSSSALRVDKTANIKSGKSCSLFMCSN